MQVFVVINKGGKRRKTDKCRCDCKELIDKGICDKIFNRYPTIVNENVINHMIFENN